jgi:hypothetical protein
LESGLLEGLKLIKWYQEKQYNKNL